jgi:hypothetical protein
MSQCRFVHQECQNYLESKPDLPGDRPVTNPKSDGTTFSYVNIRSMKSVYSICTSQRILRYNYTTFMNAVRENVFRIFGPKRNKVTGNCRKLHNESLTICTPHHYCAGDEIEKNETGGVCSAYGGGERC